MSRYVKVVPQENAGGKDFINHMKARAAAISSTIEKESIKELELILKDVLSKSPVYTGASYGTHGPHAYRVKYPSHPAYEYRASIGNYFNGGLSGWQIEVTKINQHRKQFSLTNEMWPAYLMYVDSARMAVRFAWVNHKART